MCQHLVVIGNPGEQMSGVKKQSSGVSLGLLNESCVWDFEAASICSLKPNGV